ncbi:hypothetical protein [Salinimicrobium sp. TH3]|uniref:hypothetical protein n=1 Tax=Salinimicrobium sp. TH3 TaxID=2997342 RepID=UPI002275B145|nr:hypothetical protein [Salinimicrobium sp. TH3]MCY2685976.1 hypothetical protein [Salinimicrobium sp. TH3]
MKTFNIFGVILFLLLISSCAKTFYSPDAQNLAENHRSIAIAPPVVTIQATKKMTPQDVELQQRAETQSFQEEMYSWMLKRKSQGKIKPEVQDLQTTNAKLKEAGYPEKMLTTAQMCEVLGVDGIISSNYHLSKPMSEGAAVVTTILIGVGSTNEVHAALNINDCSQQKLIWNYDHKFAGGIGSTPSRLVDNLMREASKKMPYVKK